VGGYWYLRNLVDHGSPLWPFLPLPWGDPAPPSLGGGTEVDASLLDVPRRTLERVGDRWIELFGSGFVVIGGSVVAALLSRSRSALAAAAAAIACLGLWANAPFSGAPEREFELATASTVRYLLPALAAALLACALATASPRRAGRIAGGAVLVLGLGLGLVLTARLGFPSVPDATTPLAGALLGSAVALLISRAPWLSPRSVPRGVLLGAAAVAAGLALALAAPGYVERHAASARLFGADVTRMLAGQRAFREGSQRVFGAPFVLGPLAGDRLQHRFAWLPPSAPCPQVRRRLQEGYLLLLDPPAPGAPPSPSKRCLAGVRPTSRGAGAAVYGG
jgi:hypothetical protein